MTYAIVLLDRFDCQAVDHLPGLWVPFQPLSLPGILIPEMSWNPGMLDFLLEDYGTIA